LAAQPRSPLSPAGRGEKVGPTVSKTSPWTEPCELAAVRRFRYGPANELSSKEKKAMRQSTVRTSWAIWLAVGLNLAGEARADLRLDGPNVHLGEIRAGVPLVCPCGFVNDGPGEIE